MNIYSIKDIFIAAKDIEDAKMYFNQLLLLNSNKILYSINSDAEWTCIDYFKYDNIDIKKIGLADENIKSGIIQSKKSVIILLN